MKKFTNEYETIVTTDEKGREKRTAVYRGDYFEIGLDKDGYLHFRRTSLLIFLAIAVFHFVAGFVANQGMYHIFVALPYVAAFFPLFYLGMGIFRLPKEKRKIQNDEKGFSFDRIKKYSKFLLILLSIVGVGEIIFIVLFSVKGQWGLESLFFALEAATAGLAFFLMRLQQQITIQPWNDQES